MAGDGTRAPGAGAIATATHGTGIGIPTLSEDLAAIELVAADGTLRRCPPDEDAELFRAAQVSLGALGVLTAITVRCVPALDGSPTRGSTACSGLPAASRRRAYASASRAAAAVDGR